MNGRRHQQHGVERSVGRQRRHQILFEVGGHLRGGDKRLRLAHDRDALVHRRRRHRDVEQRRLRAGDAAEVANCLKISDLERHRVVAGRQERHDVIAIERGRGRSCALQMSARHRHRHAWKRQAIRRNHVARNCARGCLRPAGRHRNQNGDENETSSSSTHTSAFLPRFYYRFLPLSL